MSSWKECANERREFRQSNDVSEKPAHKKKRSAARKSYTHIIEYKRRPDAPSIFFGEEEDWRTWKKYKSQRDVEHTLRTLQRGSWSKYYYFRIQE